MPALSQLLAPPTPGQLFHGFNDLVELGADWNVKEKSQFKITNDGQEHMSWYPSRLFSLSQPYCSTCGELGIPQLLPIKFTPSSKFSILTFLYLKRSTIGENKIKKEKEGK